MVEILGDKLTSCIKGKFLVCTCHHGGHIAFFPLGTKSHFYVIFEKIIVLTTKTMPCHMVTNHY